MYCMQVQVLVIYVSDIHYIAKRIGSYPSNERFDYFSNFQDYTF